ncbi:dynein light chain binding protein [Aureococcus anophagefferens]|uniref:Dynein light chain binding protein n=1 Tax=Aureococcus anophagefferens TaxID=44056 RepID=A0ABR1FXV6_AURAN
MRQEGEDRPSPRSAHTLVIAGEFAYMFGGCDKRRPPGPNNELYKLDMSDKSFFYWSKVPAGDGGAAPAPRWHHTAHMYNDRTMLVFGGFSADKVSRYFNDLWLYDTKSEKWSQPPPAETVPDQSGLPSLKRPWAGVPQPRGAHASTLVGSALMIFGGYGGSGFSRRDFADLHSLDMETMEWEEVETTGEPPEARSGHQLLSIEDRQLYVMGGWNSSRQFDDVHVVDLATKAWSQPAMASGPDYWGPPRWNFTAVAVFAVPFWKIFVFGGNSGDLVEGKTPTGEYCNDIMVLECGENVWVRPETVGDIPIPRSDSPMAYDDKKGTMVLYGGWRHSWHGDMAVCNVAAVVGPPYSVEDISPTIGPVTGSTLVELRGMGFSTVKGEVTVRYACPKGFEVGSCGTVIDDQTITFETPNYEHYGAVEIECRVSIGPKPLTNSKVKMSYFSVTDASQCLAFGPGLVNGCIAGNPTTICIVAKDEHGNNRSCGMDEFSIRIEPPAQPDELKDLDIEVKETKPDKDHDFDPQFAIEPECTDAEELKVQVELSDSGDGTYVAAFAAPVVGTYTITIEFMGTFDGKAGPVRGSPFQMTCVDRDEYIEKNPKDIRLSEGETEPSDELLSFNNSMDGPIVTNDVLNKIKEIREFSNKKKRGLQKLDPTNYDAIAPLIEGKEHLRDIEKMSEQYALCIDTTRVALAHLKSRGNQVDRMMDQLGKAIVDWTEVLALVEPTATAITPTTIHFANKTVGWIEEYEQKIKDLDESFRGSKVFSMEVGHDDALKMLDKNEKEFVEETKILEKNAHLCAVFEFPEKINKSQEILQTMQKTVDFMRAAWGVSEDITCFITDAKALLWRELEIEDLEDGAKAQTKKLSGLNKTIRWCPLYKDTSRAIKDFINTIPLITALRSKAMRPRHWDLLRKATGKEFTPPYEDEDLQLGGLLSLNLHEFNADVEEICDQATKEEKIEVNLESLTERWRQIEFLADMYKGTEVPLLKVQEEDWESLENDQLTVQGMMASRYIAQFEKEVASWQVALVTISDVYTTINEIQRTWSYLEPLFIHSDEVKRELPVDAERFAGIDVEIKDVLTSAWEVKNIKEACNVDGLLSRLEGELGGLDLCKKSLADFLDGRRRQFPRYYFTSEADLLDILSNGSQPEKVMIHTSKIYLSTKTLRLDPENRTASNRPMAVGWVADVGKEYTPFEPAVPLEGKVEIYMQTVLDAMKSTLFQNLKRSVIRYAQMERKHWVMAKDEDGARPADPAQIILLTLAINYVQEVEESFEKIEAGNEAALAEYNVLQIDQLGDLVRLTQGDLDGENRTRIMVCITMDAHGRDIVQKLVRERVNVVSAFQWQSQLKHKFRVPPSYASHIGRDPHLRSESGQRAEIAICDAILPYDYEYLGNGPRLVITPLTDRIYVTATQALNLKMGCAPAGPAGTGKTESTKDLASALAKCCYVFNCSPEMDYKGLGNIFKGLGSSGSWGCFDEFNRLIPEVLSVCTVQFKAVCDGIKAEAARVTVEGDEVSLDPTCGAFITMNPGYLGRSELPEGLKALFRPMTVMVPDLVLICENMLMAQGFVDAKSLASKFYGLYSLLKELLSKQLHYDWGLRAVKSVLVIAGTMKRADPQLPEDSILMRALRDSNIPKIVKEDQVVFFGLLGDLFPGINPERKRDMNLEDAIVKACGDLGLDPDDEFCLKTVQLEELLAIRHCVFVMGPAGAGKSQCWRTLAQARKVMDPEKLTTMIKDVNPKSVKTEELYGFISMATREWRDGLLSVVMRNLGRIEDELPKWILLDGDLDANWIESMNSVMDDNRMLTLASNERIPLKPHMRMIFEIRDLKHATPATVSRAGILYISTNEGSQWRSLIAAWIKQRPESEECKEWLREICAEYVGESLDWMKLNIKTVLPLEDMNLVQSLLYMLALLLKPDNTGTREALEIVFNFCLIWALGSPLGQSDDGVQYRALLSDYWRGQWKNVKFPTRGASNSVFDYYLEPKSNQFEQWSKSPFFYHIDFDTEKMNMAQITVPTAETCSVAFWMSDMVKNHHPVMLAGPSGTGKTQQVMGMLKDQNPTDILSATINFNFYTTSDVLQNTMCLPLEKKTGTNFGPPGQAYLVYFVDDLNLPEVDSYNTQSAIALLRQQMEYGHIYDMTKLAQNPVKNISKTQVVACMNPTAGSFVINPRLQRWFVTFAIGMPSRSSLNVIYDTFLMGHLKADFPAEVASLKDNIIKAAMNLHKEVMEKFRKTATNFHYEFNIRHLANVFQGLLVAQAEQITTGEKLVHLWLHESERVYGDRLVSPEDLRKYNDLAQGQARKLFQQFPVDKFYAKENSEPLIFCHFCEDIEDPIYDQITGIDKMLHTLEGALELYNESNAVMDLVLFEDAMKHVARISRIVLNEGGHALLVGVGGSGKQSLSRLAAFICHYTVTQIVISSSYSITDLKDDLKGMYNKAGLKEEGVMFLLTDSQITNERFLIYINDLLASGNIPDLFAVDEVDNIVNSVANRVKAAGLEQTRANCWDYFITEIRRNLHVVLAFSPVGDDFRNRSRKFPALVNSTVIDWFQPWPEDALLSVGQRFLEEIDVGTAAHRTVIEKFMPYSFIEVNNLAKRFQSEERRHVYTTPKSFLELLKLYQVLLEHKREDSDKSITRLKSGLKKMQETSDAVTEIEASLKITLEDAEQKKTKAEGISEVVSKEKAIVEVETAGAEQEAAKVAVVQKDVGEKQRSTAEDLAKAEPAVEAAMAALDSLDAKSLAECKSMIKPPAGVDDIFISTMILLADIYPAVLHNKKKVKDRSWDAAKKQCLGNIKEYIEYLKMIKVKVDESVDLTTQMKEIRPYLALEHFKVEIIAGKNSAAAGLTAFVLNIVTYYDIVITVEPKRIALAEANAQLEAANAKLKAVNEKVADLQSKLAILTDNLDVAERDKQEALDAVEKGQRKLDLAQRLTSALASENERWKESVIQMEASKNLLTGDVLLASSFISYAGPFTKSFRDILMQEKFFAYLIKSFNGGAEAPAEGAPEMPMSPTFDPISILTTDAEIAVWNQDSLPADAVSTENGSILCNTSRWPLIIDPQLQGISWLRNKESAPARNLQIVRLGQKDMMRKLERALESGHTILIENLSESLDAVLSPIIQRATIKRGRTLYVKVGDSEVEFHPNFRLYLHTKLSNPHYPPEIQAETTLINFTVTQAGLSDQLLTLVVQKERGDLAELAESLIKQQNGFKIKMKELEDSILEKLANAEGDITEDVDLIEGLEETKRISIDINKKSAIANETQANIRITSNKYKSVADRSSQLFFLMNDLAKIHSYYVYSLAAFTKVFYRGIDLVTAKKAVEVNEDGEEVPPEEEAEVVELNDEELAARCVVLMNSITLTTFNYIRRGLFEKDKLTIATMVTLRIAVSDEVLSADDVGYLYLGKIATDPGNMGPLHEWMPEAIWPKVKALEGLKRFNGLGDNMHSDSDEWLAWFDNATPENAKLPGDYQKLLTPFDRLILLRALRPDRVSTALRLYIGETMGNDYVFQAPFNMPATYDETSSQTPVFFVLFPGVDPTPWVEDLGKELNISQDNGLFCNISMGQGQEKPAEAVLERFAKTGGWVMLQNCHLMTSWVPQLERLLEVVQESAHDDFRCFISAEPPGMAGMKNMPESLLQSCVKVSNEAPADIKSNLTRAWDNFNQGRIDACTKPDDFKSCLFSLCWFHAIVLGRRRFGAQGWSRKYSFNTGDLVICSNVLSSYLDANEGVPWDDLRYIFGEIMYGGHITDAWDRRTCNTYLLVLMLPALREGLELGPKFKSPDPTTLNYDDYLTYVNAELPEESPPQFGLHPNAEIGYLTSSTADLFATIMSLGGGSGGGGGDSTSIIKATMTDLKERCPEVLEMLTIGRKAEPLLEEPDKGPYIVCALQECRRMNVLIGEIGRTLMELEKGLGGQLNMTQAMEDLCSAFLINQWPGRNPFAQCTWEKNAWPSKKGLVTQFADMLARYAQLAAWTEELVTPISVWLSGLFNPMAYLTGVTQVTSRATGQPLDKMTQETHVTTYVTPDAIPQPAEFPESGAFVHGLFIEGARWPVGDEVEEAEEFGGASVGGVLLESRLKELMPPMPVLYIKAVPVQVTWEPSAVGYLRHVDDIYECPVFITTMRGPTYIFLATLKTAEPKSKWTLTGTALMMQTDD